MTLTLVPINTPLGIGPLHCNSQVLWKLDWLNLPSTATVASLSTSATSFTDSLWHHCLGHLCGYCLLSLVRCGLLGFASGGASLGCQVRRLGKRVKLHYPHSETMSHRPLDLVHFDVWGSTSSTWSSWICIWQCVFRLSGLSAWQTG